MIRNQRVNLKQGRNVGFIKWLQEYKIDKFNAFVTFAEEDPSHFVQWFASQPSNHRKIYINHMIRNQKSARQGEFKVVTYLKEFREEIYNHFKEKVKPDNLEKLFPYLKRKHERFWIDDTPPIQENVVPSESKEKVNEKGSDQNPAIDESESVVPEPPNAESYQSHKRVLEDSEKVTKKDELGETKQNENKKRRNLLVSELEGEQIVNKNTSSQSRNDGQPVNNKINPNKVLLETGVNMELINDYALYDVIRQWKTGYMEEVRPEGPKPFEFTREYVDKLLENIKQRGALTAPLHFPHHRNAMNVFQDKDYTYTAGIILTQFPLHIQYVLITDLIRHQTQYHTPFTKYLNREDPRTWAEYAMYLKGKATRYRMSIFFEWFKRNMSVMYQICFLATWIQFQKNLFEERTDKGKKSIRFIEYLRKYDTLFLGELVHKLQPTFLKKLFPLNKIVNGEVIPVDVVGEEFEPTLGDDPKIQNRECIMSPCSFRDDRGIVMRTFSGSENEYIAHHPITLNDIKYKTVYVYSDMPKARLVGDVYAQLLRTVNASEIDKGNEVIYRRYVDPHYLPLARNHFDTIEILLTDKQGEKLPFADESSWVTLHVRKRVR